MKLTTIIADEATVTRRARPPRRPVKTSPPVSEGHGAARSGARALLTPRPATVPGLRPAARAVRTLSRTLPLRALELEACTGSLRTSLILSVLVGATIGCLLFIGMQERPGLLPGIALLLVVGTVGFYLWYLGRMAGQMHSLQSRLAPGSGQGAAGRSVLLRSGPRLPQLPAPLEELRSTRSRLSTCQVSPTLPETSFVPLTSAPSHPRPGTPPILPQRSGTR